MHTPKTAQAALDRVWAKMLELPEKMAPRMIGVTQADAEAMLMEAVREALKELDPDDGPASDPQPAA